MVVGVLVKGSESCMNQEKMVSLLWNLLRDIGGIEH
jgi:hypothetical protein